MKPRSCAWIVVGVAWAVAGCGEQPPRPSSFSSTEDGAGGLRGPVDFEPTTPSGPGAGLGEDPEGKRAILDGVVQLIKAAPTNPGGQNFTQAVERLNQFFEGADPRELELSSAAREYLTARLGQRGQSILTMLQRRDWNIQDARHIEDCMLLQAVARRVAGDGDDLTRVRRVFDWMVRQIQLVPAGVLAAPPDLPQAAVRPYDVLLRGMATETSGEWAERAWLFIALCRQLGLDAGLLTYTPRNEPGRSLYWVCGVLIDGQVYLFDARIGLPIPGPDGQAVATLEQAIADPELLERLDLPGEVPYMTTAADLAAGAIGVMIDSTPGYLAPRMRALEKNLVGRNRVILYRDPAEQQEAFARALGRRFGGAELWPLPMTVFVRLFGDGRFVRATQFPMRFFDARFPLLPARMAQLRGETAEAIQRYITLRYAEKPLENDGKTPIPPAVQRELDLYATYFLGLAQLEAGATEQARNFFGLALKLLPGAGQDPSLCSLYRWGARTNLALLEEAAGQDAERDAARETRSAVASERREEAAGRRAEAIRDYCAPSHTFQDVGNRLRARDLIWRDPFVPGRPVPPAEPDVAPAPTSAPSEPAPPPPAGPTPDSPLIAPVAPATPAPSPAPK